LTSSGKESIILVMKIVPRTRGGERTLHGPAAVLAVVALVAAGCSSTTSSGTGSTRSALAAVAAEDFWGSLLRQLGGDKISVTSIISDPNVDPHDYEPKSSDGMELAKAGIVVVNGVGYDTWAEKLLAANPVPARVVINIGDLVGAKNGDNPHRWYSPSDVATAIDAMTGALKRADAADAAYFDQQHDQLTSVALKPYDDVRAQIRSTYAGTPIGISESIFAPMAADLGLEVLTPERFADAIAEGNEPTAADKQAVDRQIAAKEVKVFVYNSQNSTPDVRALVDKSKKAGIAVSTVTETLTPKGATFEEWQTRQLTDLRRALAGATGR
jgi:zinc/manganese transport system substrate-binding protein